MGGGGGYSGFAGFPYGVGGFGNIAGSFGYAGGGATLSTVTNSLASGIGNEGVIKDVLVRGLAEATTPEATLRATRAYDAALARVADSKVGEKLRLVKRERTVGSFVTLTMKKNNEQITGNLVSEENDLITVETAREEITVRKADVDRIVRPKSNVKAAAR